MKIGTITTNSKNKIIFQILRLHVRPIDLYGMTSKHYCKHYSKFLEIAVIKLPENPFKISPKNTETH